MNKEQSEDGGYATSPNQPLDDPQKNTLNYV